MGTIKFALHMLKSDLKRSLFYWGSLVFSTIVVFVFFNMTANPVYQAETRIQTGQARITATSSFTTILALVVIVIAMVMAFFANSYYLQGKTKELAIESMSGGSVLTLATYILTQNAVIVFASLPLGVFLGYLLNPILNGYLYSRIGISGNPWEIFTEGLILAIISLITEMVWLVLVNTGYVYRQNLVDLISEDRKMMKTEEKVINLPSFVFALMYIIPMGLFLYVDPDPYVFLIISILGLFGVSGILKKLLPELLSKLTMNRYIDDPHWLVAIGNLKYSLSQSTTLIQMVIASATMLICFMGSYYKDPSQLVIIVMSYVILTFLMAVSIAYKIVIEAGQRSTTFKHMRMLGYVTSDLKKTLKIQIIGLFLVIILFPVLYFSIILARFVLGGMMSLKFALSISIFYVVIFIITGFICYFIYRSVATKQRGR